MVFGSLAISLAFVTNMQIDLASNLAYAWGEKKEKWKHPPISIRFSSNISLELTQLPC